MNKFLAIIPARIGSKSVPKKNIHDLNGKPLVSYTINASKRSTFIKTTIVSTDSQEIINIAKQNNVEYLRRSKELSNDVARTEPVIKDVIDRITNIDNYDYFVLLQPTSPLRSYKHIDSACKKFLSTNSDALISVSQQENDVLKVLIEDDEGFLKSGFNDEYPFMPRQQLPEVFKPNGAIYICKIDLFRKNISLLQKKTSFILMDDVSSLDIDTFGDLQRVENILKSK